MPATEHARELALAAAAAAADKKAENIVLIDVSEQLVITDVFLLASAPNERQVKSIVDAVEERLHAAGEKPIRREGHRDGRWVLLDYADLVVHVQHNDERTFYELDRLWRDCPIIPFTDPAVAAADTGPGSGEGGR
ncbi:MAG TPA: ribosome silencing factor [Actinocatenispora sp.]